MSAQSAVQWWREQAVDVFQKEFTAEYYGFHLFPREEGNYYYFQAHEKGGAAWLRPVPDDPQESEAMLVGEEQKFPSQQVIPSLRPISHCEPIPFDNLEDGYIQKIESKLQRGAKVLAGGMNKLFVSVLLIAANSSTRPYQDLTGALAEIGDELSAEGFNANYFLFPKRFKNRLITRGIINPDTEIDNVHYVGKTVSGMYAFAVSELPEDIAIVYASDACVTLYKTGSFWRDEQYRPFTFAVCGRVEFNPIVKTTHAVVSLSKIDQLIIDKPKPQLQPKASEVADVFSEIQQIIDSSPIETVFKDIALYDLSQARVAYESDAYKACIVMLGTVLEGLMLATIRRPEILDKIRNDANPPRVIQRMGAIRHLSDDQLAEKIASELGFEEYKTIIHYLIPTIERLKVEGIQTFRNAVHPWKTVKEPAIYATPNKARAINHVTSLVILAKTIISFSP